MRYESRRKNEEIICSFDIRYVVDNVLLFKKEGNEKHNRF